MSKRQVAKVCYFDSSNNEQFVYVEMREKFGLFLSDMISAIRSEKMETAMFYARDEQRYRIYWIDEDNDKIHIDKPLSYCIFLLRDGNKKIYIEEINNPSTFFRLQKPQQQSLTAIPTQCASKNTSQLPVHHGIRCDNCGVSSISGFRYKCVECKDYDLCEKCEQKKVHADHLMCRLPTYRHTQLCRHFQVFKDRREENFPLSDLKLERHDRRNVADEIENLEEFLNFYRVTRDLKEGVELDDTAIANPSAFRQRGPEGKEKQASNASAEDLGDEQRQGAPEDNKSEDKVSLLFSGMDPAYTETAVEALKGFSDVLGKLLDPIGIKVSVDIGRKKDTVSSAHPSGLKAIIPESENLPPSTLEAENKQITAEARPQPISSDIQVPIVINLSGVPSNSSITLTGLGASQANHSTASSTQGEQPEQNRDTKINLDPTYVLTSDEEPPEIIGAEKKLKSSSIDSSWTVVDQQFNKDENQLIFAAAAAAIPTSPQQRFYPDRINEAVNAMIGMGFSNTNGWLANLLLTVDGNIEKALKLLDPSG